MSSRMWLSLYRRARPLISVGVAAAACNDPSGPLSPAFATDAPEYTLRATTIGYEGEIPYLFTNPTAASVFIVNCSGGTSLRLEQRQGDTWVVAWAPVVLACLSPPIVVAGNSQYRGTVRISDCSFRTNCGPKFLTATIPGQYRLVWDDFLTSFDSSKYPFGKALPLRQRTSNTFTLRTGAS